MSRPPRPIALPDFVRRRLDGIVAAFLAAPDRAAFDFSSPAGEPALVGPDSVSWRIFKNPVAVFVGGVTAVLLELAEPRVRDGIWNHSTFSTDPLTRLRRTGLAAMITVYGPRRKTEAMIGNVVALHDRVKGRTSDGEPYFANDPELLEWVQVTANFGFMEAYHRLVRPLSHAERDAFLAESRIGARLYGVDRPPATRAELDARFRSMEDNLMPSPIILEFLDIMMSRARLPLPVIPPLQRVLVRTAVDLLPDAIKRKLELERFGRVAGWQRGVALRAASTTDRIVLPSLPAVVACRRLGLPADYLYRP